MSDTHYQRMENGMNYDVAVIGGGVVGCAVLRELTDQGLHCILCEAEPQMLSHASSGNCGIVVQNGFDAPLNSRELKCLLDGNQLNEPFYQEFNIPYKKVGGLIVAWTEEDLVKLPEIVNKAHEMGMLGVKQISVYELQRKEPHLSCKALGAILVPDEMIIDPWLLPITLAHLAVLGGAAIKRESEVLSGEFENGVWTLATSSDDRITAKTVINCGGLFGDRIESLHHKSPFTIKPRKGQFAVFSQSAESLVNSIIYPIPTERSKGVQLYPTVYGNIVIGPTAEEQEDRKTAEIDEKVIDCLLEKAFDMVPALREHEVVERYAGLRPATEHRDYWLEQQPKKNWIVVGGIRSTGLSACLGIAKHVALFLPKKKAFETCKDDAHKVSKCLSDRRVVKNALEFGGRSWKITHPLTRLGISTARGLLTFQAKK